MCLVGSSGVFVLRVWELEKGGGVCGAKKRGGGRGWHGCFPTSRGSSKVLSSSSWKVLDHMTITCLL